MSNEDLIKSFNCIADRLEKIEERFKCFDNMGDKIDNLEQKILSLEVEIQKILRIRELPKFSTRARYNHGDVVSFRDKSYRFLGFRSRQTHYLMNYSDPSIDREWELID